MESGKCSAHSFVIDIPKPRHYFKKCGESSDPFTKCKPQNLKKFEKKSIDENMINYPVLDEKPIGVHKLERNEVLLSYKQFLKIQHAEKHKINLALNVFDRYKITYSDLCRRLYVQDPPNDVVGIKDVDDDFFNSVEGRPLQHDRVPEFKSLTFLYHELIRNKIKLGFKKDAVLNIEVNQELEQEKYELAVTRCTQQMKNFDRFISDDYHRSLALLTESERLKSKVEVQKAELSYCAVEKFFTEAKLVGLDYTYKRLKKLGRFLYYLSPPSWRAQNREFAQSVEIEAKGFEFGSSKDEDTFSVMFENMKNEYLSNIVKPALYFQRPEDLMKVFETIEKHQQYHFDHVTHTAPHTKKLYHSIKSLRDLIALETSMIATVVENFKGLNNYYQTRGDQLEAKFFRILHGLFYECVGGPDVLKFRLHLEFCYESVYGEPPISMNITSIARELEAFYMKYSMRLEALHSDKVQKAVKQYEESERLKLKKSKEASKELRLFDRLNHQLLLSFKPPPTRPKIPHPKWSSLKNKVKKTVKIKEESKRLTEAEEDYLRYFTDWCSDEDPDIYLHTRQHID